MACGWVMGNKELINVGLILSVTSHCRVIMKIPLAVNTVYILLTIICFTMNFVCVTAIVEVFLNLSP